MKVGFKGVHITRTCFPDVFDDYRVWLDQLELWLFTRCASELKESLIIPIMI